MEGDGGGGAHSLLPSFSHDSHPRPAMCLFGLVLKPAIHTPSLSLSMHSSGVFKSVMWCRASPPPVIRIILSNESSCASFSSVHRFGPSQDRAKFHVLLTSYEMLALEAGPLSRGLQYGVLVVDEVCRDGGLDLGWDRTRGHKALQGGERGAATPHREMCVRISQGGDRNRATRPCRAVRGGLQVGGDAGP